MCHVFECVLWGAIPPDRLEIANTNTCARLPKSGAAENGHVTIAQDWFDMENFSVLGKLAENGGDFDLDGPAF